MKRWLRSIVLWGGGALWIAFLTLWIASRWWFSYCNIGPLQTSWVSFWVAWGDIVFYGPGFDATDWVPTHLGFVDPVSQTGGLITRHWSWWSWYFDAGPPMIVAFPPLAPSPSDVVSVHSLCPSDAADGEARPLRFLPLLPHRQHFGEVPGVRNHDRHTREG